PKATQVVLSRVAAIGASFTAGFQSGGLLNEFQENSWPNLIAKQYGASMQQPLIAAPGISSTPGRGPLKFENGSIVPGDTYTNPLLLLQNATLPRPYDNLGVPGADLQDMLEATSATTAGGNSFYDLILRNPNFGNTTQLQQLIASNPTMVVALLGGNDVLGAALSGTAIVGTTITPTADFSSRFNEIIDEIQSKTNAVIVVGNLPAVTNLPYVTVLSNAAYSGVFQDFGPLGTLPVVFDGNFQAINFNTSGSGAPLYLPLLTAETGVKHLLLPYLSEYQGSGLGVPDSAAIVSFLVSIGQDPAVAQATAPLLVLGMQANGLTPSGVAIPGNLSLTATEEATIVNSTNEFNQVILTAAAQKSIVVADLITPFNAVVSGGVAGSGGISSVFVLVNPATTMFSLDGFHPNDAGMALIAKAYIEAMNQYVGTAVPAPNPADFAGQYTGTVISDEVIGIAARQARALFE
ncbi:MAG TPA: hypothetical protein PKV71_20310, partial [Calditrichia bacterium]|nr:hypothetical protein [Calditrichia bacterium]